MEIALELDKAVALFEKLPEAVQAYFLGMFDEAVANGFSWKRKEDCPLYIYGATAIHLIPRFSNKIAIKAINLFRKERERIWSKLLVKQKPDGSFSYADGEHVAMLLAFLAAAAEKRFGKGAEILELEIPIQVVK